MKFNELRRVQAETRGPPPDASKEEPRRGRETLKPRIKHILANAASLEKEPLPKINIPDYFLGTLKRLFTRCLKAKNPKMSLCLRIIKHVFMC